MAEFRLKDVQRMSHAYIISAQNMEESLHTASGIAAAAVCTAKSGAPCMQCRACRKAQAGIHPDIISIRRLSDDKGRQKREIGVEQIRQMAADAVVLPNEAKRKVYMIEDADTMNIPAQNAALKLLEEPPRGVVFLLCVVNAQQLLPTVRSRCVEINRNGEKPAEDEESMKLASDYIKAVSTGDPARLCRFSGQSEGLDARAAAAFIDSANALLSDMLCGRKPDLGISPADMLRLTALMERCSAYLRVNVGVKHIFGLLAVNSLPGGGNRG